MKKAMVLCVVLVALSACISVAGGLSLRWNNCSGDGGVQNLVFACSGCAGNRALVGSFTLDTDLPAALSNELVVDITTAGATLAPWWELRSNAAENFVACRNGSVSIGPQDGGSCPDLFGLLGSMNIAAFQPYRHGPNSARLLSVNAVPSTDPVDLVVAEGAERGVARWTITNARTFGSPSCSGCLLGACIQFNSCNLSTVGNANNRLITGPAAPGSDYVTWQGGVGTNCPAATPTKNATWGKVKSLYR